jgi:hypothetical protein
MSETTTGQRGALSELNPDAEARQYCPIGDTHTVRGGGGLRLQPPRQRCPAGDGQAHPGDPSYRRTVVVRGCGPRATHRRPRALQRRARRLRPFCRRELTASPRTARWVELRAGCGRGWRHRFCLPPTPAKSPCSASAAGPSVIRNLSPTASAQHRSTPTVDKGPRFR